MSSTPQPLGATVLDSADMGRFRHGGKSDWTALPTGHAKGPHGRRGAGAAWAGWPPHCERRGRRPQHCTRSDVCVALVGSGLLGPQHPPNGGPSLLLHLHPRHQHPWHHLCNVRPRATQPLLLQPSRPPRMEHTCCHGVWTSRRPASLHPFTRHRPHSPGNKKWPHHRHQHRMTGPLLSGSSAAPPPPANWGLPPPFPFPFMQTPTLRLLPTLLPAHTLTGSSGRPGRGTCRSGWTPAGWPSGAARSPRQRPRRPRLRFLTPCCCSDCWERRWQGRMRELSTPYPLPSPNPYSVGAPHTQNLPSPPQARS